MMKNISKAIWLISFPFKCFKFALKSLNGAFFVVLTKPNYESHKIKVSLKFTAFVVVFLGSLFLFSLGIILNDEVEKNLEVEKNKQGYYDEQMSEMKTFYVKVNDYEEVNQAEFDLILDGIGGKGSKPFSFKKTFPKIKETDFPSELKATENEFQSVIEVADNNIAGYELLEKYSVIKKIFQSKIPNGWPLKNNVGYKTSGFGLRPSISNRDEIEFHEGVDIASASGTQIIATADGVVSFSGSKNGYGKVVVVDHDYNFKNRLCSQL